MLNTVLYGLHVIAYLGLVVLLVFVCFRTRSKGLILISVILLTGGPFDWVFEQVGKLYMDRLTANVTSGEAEQNMNAAEFLMTLSLIQHLLHSGLCLLGGFLVYREWRQGKFRQPPA